MKNQIKKLKAEIIKLKAIDKKREALTIEIIDTYVVTTELRNVYKSQWNEFMFI